jgi:SNF2 family DNA or RNA helicase
MGLGKTVQVVTFLSGLFKCNVIRHVLIVLPLSLVENWKSEFLNWSGCHSKFYVYIFHSLNTKKKLQLISQFKKTGGILIVTYGTIVSQSKLFESNFKNRGYKFDYIILDEGKVFFTFYMKII